MFRLNYFFSVLLIAVFLSGCGIQAATYVMDKERVGIDYKGGNAGYLFGDPLFQVPQKKTRKIYVLELSKAIAESEVKQIEQDIKAAKPDGTSPDVSGDKFAQDASASSWNRDPVIDPILDEDVMPRGQGSSVAYTVEKDDTLQKIAKKFYGSYGKWVKIYEANKDTVKNPNFVKPGTILMIPAVDEQG